MNFHIQQKRSCAFKLRKWSFILLRSLEKIEAAHSLILQSLTPQSRDASPTAQSSASNREDIAEYSKHPLENPQ